MLFGEFARFLNEISVGDKDRPGSLIHIAYVAGEKEYAAAKTADKEQVIAVLSEYYSAPDRFELIWNSLSAPERKIISLHLWSAGSVPESYADEVAAEFGVAENKERAYYYYAYNALTRYKIKYAERRSKLWLLYPGNGSWLFINELRKVVGEMKREYTQVAKNIKFSVRETRVHDFANIVKFCNTNKVMMTKNGVFSKPVALKLWKFCGYEEYALDVKAEPEGMRTVDGLLATYPLTVLCTIGGLLAVSEGICAPGAKALSLINLPYAQLVKKLFETYLTSKSFDEISMMKGLKSKRGHHPYEARQNLAEELKHCAAGQPIYTNEFEKYLRIANKRFARKEERHIVTAGSSSYYEYGVGWESYESPLINTILNFFWALGVIDIAWNDATKNHSGYRRPIAFRVNALGAYVLGLSDAYVAPAVRKEKIAGGFTALPDYTIVVHDGANRYKHELYFERLFTKVSATQEASIYRLDFDTIVRATESGASVAEIRAYLSASDKPLPENVARALEDWGKQAGRIKLRQVMILECDDAALLEEVLHYKGMGEFVKEKVAAAAVVDGNAAGKIKKVIEKNKRFCHSVI